MFSLLKSTSNASVVYPVVKTWEFNRYTLSHTSSINMPVLPGYLYVSIRHLWDFLERDIFLFYYFIQFQSYLKLLIPMLYNLAFFRKAALFLVGCFYLWILEWFYPTEYLWVLRVIRSKEIFYIFTIPTCTKNIIRNLVSFSLVPFPKRFMTYWFF